MSAAHAAKASRKVCTLVLAEDGRRVLLGMKKRGFGQGKYNGFGGKVEAGETVAAAAARELREEAGVGARLSKRGVIWFDWPESERADAGSHAMVRQGIEVHVFSGADVDGEPAETDEMRPEWFDKDAVPFEKMWPDDELWFPHLFAGRSFVAYFLFKGEDAFLEHHVLPLSGDESLDVDGGGCNERVRGYLMRAVEAAHAAGARQ